MPRKVVEIVDKREKEKKVVEITRKGQGSSLVCANKQNMNVFLSGKSETLSMLMLLTQYKHQTTLRCDKLSAVGRRINSLLSLFTKYLRDSTTRAISKIRR